MTDLLKEFQASPENINGSHRAGLDSVPFDDYHATLHRGERVLTAMQAANYGAANAPDYGPVVDRLDALVTVVDGLRSDQQKQTGDIIVSNITATMTAADTVAVGVKSAATDNAWAQKSRAVIS